MSQKNHIQRVHIWDDPQSRINFLETTLADKEWEAVIYEPAGTGTGRLPALKKQFDDKGYKTSISTDKNGIPTLTLTHFSHETGLLKTIRELGLVRGTKHNFENMGAKLGSFIKKGVDVSKFLVSNPAKITGFVYMLGDLIFAFNNDSTEKNKTVKALTKAYGYFGTLQSLIFMSYATEGPEQYRNEFKRKLKQAGMEQKDLDSLKNWLNEAEKPNIHRTIEKNAITIGSLVQIVGRILYMARGLLIYKDGKKSEDNGRIFSGIGNIVDGSLSISGWIALASKPMKYDEKDKAHWATPKGIYQRSRENTEKFASTVFLGSSLLGVTSDLIKESFPEGKKDQNLNPKSLYNNLTSTLKDKDKLKNAAGGSVFAGNATYLVGDVLVGLLPKEKYEGGQIDESDLLAELAAESFQQLDFLIGKEERKSVLLDIVQYYVTSTLKAKDQSTSLEEEQYITMRVFNLAETLLEGKEVDKPMQELVQRAADVVLRFGKDQRDEVRHALSQTLSESKTIAASQDALCEAIAQAVAHKESLMVGKGAIQLPKAVMQAEVKKPLAALVQTIPGKQTAQEAMALYSTVEAFLTRKRASDATSFSDYVAAQAHPPHPRVAEASVNSGVSL